MFSQSKIELLAWLAGQRMWTFESGAIGQLVSVDMWKFYEILSNAKSIDTPHDAEGPCFAYVGSLIGKKRPK